MIDETDGFVGVFNDVINQGGSFTKCCPIKHLTKIRCREDILLNLQNDEEINKRFQLNINRINRWWWSVTFVDKNKVPMGGKLCK